MDYILVAVIALGFLVLLRCSYLDAMISSFARGGADAAAMDWFFACKYPKGLLARFVKFLHYYGEIAR